MAHVVRQGILSTVLERMATNTSDIHTPALRVVGNVATGPDHLVEPLLRMGVLTALDTLLAKATDNVKREIFWTLSNITAGELSHVRLFIESPLFVQTIKYATESPGDVGLQALWALANATTHINRADDLVDAFLEDGLVDVLYRNLTSPGDTRKAVALEGCFTCLKACGKSPSNKVAKQLMQTDGCRRLLSLKRHGGPIGRVSARMLKFLEFFSPTLL